MNSPKLAKAKADRRHWINVSKRQHDAWAVAHKTNNMRLRNRLWHEWKDAVAKVTQLNALIAKLDKVSGATSCSLDLAKAVAVFEGGRGSDGKFHPYRDVLGVWTIGYGHTNADPGLRVDANTAPLTGVEATTLLLHDLNTNYAPAVVHYLKAYNWSVSQKVFDSLTSFAYNLGPGYFTTDHDMGKQMQAHNLKGMASVMLEYDDPGSPAEAGLLRRRKWEAQLLLGGTYVVS